MRFSAQVGISVFAGLLVNSVTWADPILLLGPPTLTVTTHAFAPGGFPVSAGDSSDAKTSNSGPLTSSIDGVTYVGTSTANALATDLGEVGVSADITGFYNVSPLDAESTATWSQTYQNTSGAAASFTVIQTLYPMSKRCRLTRSAQVISRPAQSTAPSSRTRRL